jgi:hypothetical protein
MHGAMVEAAAYVLERRREERGERSEEREERETRKKKQAVLRCSSTRRRIWAPIP